MFFLSLSRKAYYLALAQKNIKAKEEEMDRWEKEYVELREDFQDLLDLKDDTEMQEDVRNVGDGLWSATLDSIPQFLQG